MAKKRTSRTKRKKVKPSVGLIVVVNTDNDDALDVVIDAAEGLIEELEGELDLTVTFAANLPPEDEDDDHEVDEDDDLDNGDDGSDESEESAESEESEDEDDDEPEVDEEYLESLSLADLKKVAKEHDVAVVKGKRSATYIKEILAAVEEGYEEEDDGYITLAELKKKSSKELKDMAKEYGIKVRTSWDKDDIIEAIVEVAGEED